MAELHLGLTRQKSRRAQILVQAEFSSIDLRLFRLALPIASIDTAFTETDNGLGYFIKSLDQQNINNAFVSGMYAYHSSKLLSATC